MKSGTVFLDLVMDLALASAALAGTVLAIMGEL